LESFFIKNSWIIDGIWWENTGFYLFKKYSRDKKLYYLDMSGRIIMRDSLSKDYINIQALTSGNYILQLTSKDNILSFKFIKK